MNSNPEKSVLIQRHDRLELTFPRMYASAPQPLPFAPSLDIRAFLLERMQGNLLIYSVTKFEADAPTVQALGGITRQYLNQLTASRANHETWVD